MIISFAIFVIFVVLIFIILNPFKQNDYNPTINGIVSDAIEKNITINVLTTSIKVKGNVENLNPPETCFSIGDSFFPESGMKVIAKSGGVKFGAKYVKTGDDKRIYIGDTEIRDVFYDIYFSTEFDDSSLSGCKELNYDGTANSEYQIGQTKPINFASNKSIYELNKMCNGAGYEKLKENFAIPASRNFGFLVKDSSGVEIARCEKTITKNVDVYSSDRLIRVINTEGNINSATLQVVVW